MKEFTFNFISPEALVQSLKLKSYRLALQP